MMERKAMLQFRRRAGQALVEFTLIVVVLFLLMAGTVDVARLVTAYTYLNNAAQEGAIYGAMYAGVGQEPVSGPNHPDHHRFVPEPVPKFW